MRILLALLLAAAGLITSLPGCTRDEKTGGEKIIVIVTILPYQDFVEKVGKERVEVKVLIPPGASPANYEPTPRQIADIEKAQLLIKVGAPLPFEKVWLEKIISGRKDLEIVNASEGIAVKNEDPHIWLSPRLAKQQVKNICRGLVRIDPGHREFYERNRDAFIKELEELDREIREELSGIKNPRFMVFHPSFGYFAEEYGLEQVSMEHEGKEPGSRELADLIEYARKNGVKVIFAEPQFRDKDAKVIAETIGGRVEFLNPLARDYVANMREVTKSLKQGMSRNE